MSWIEVDAKILVEESSGRYRFWDVGREIPRPSEGEIRAQIQLPSGWDAMYYNCTWGKSYDPDHREGTWLKQKMSNCFHVDLGYHTYTVRYRID